MPNPPKPAEERLTHNTSVLLNQRQLDAVKSIMKRDRVTKGKAIRTLIDRGIEHELHT